MLALGFHLCVLVWCYSRLLLLLEFVMSFSKKILGAFAMNFFLLNILTESAFLSFMLLLDVFFSFCLNNTSREKNRYFILLLNHIRWLYKCKCYCDSHEKNDDDCRRWRWLHLLTIKMKSLVLTAGQLFTLTGFLLKQELKHFKSWLKWQLQKWLSWFSGGNGFEGRLEDKVIERVKDCSV